MAHLPRLLPFFLLLLGVHASVCRGSPTTPLPSTHSTSICPKSGIKCGTVDISYPFYLSNATGETNDYNRFSCGYTDLKISCIWDGKNDTPIIQLGGDNYTVLDIRYDTFTVVLADTDALRGGNCPRVRHGFNFGQDHKWLEYTGSLDNLTFFFGCDPALVDPPLAGGIDKYQIKCTDFNNSPSTGPSFVFTKEELYSLPYYESLSKTWKCQNVTVPIDGRNPLLRSNQATLPSGGYGEVLKKGFELAWNSNKDEQCFWCQRSQGQCAYSQNKTLLGCVCPDGNLRPPNKDCNAPN
uniref:Wall-associated receptor kinase galacturonan-binding domain-containing protein n=1 Tax=Oryza brachyantha TaxID=4533 RepID=J3L325_ORYBR